jgi:hypothetical protein
LQKVAIEVDLLVPAEFAAGSPKRWSVEIPPHDRQSFRRVPGLGVAMLDHDTETLSSLEPDTDDRSVEVKVAGVVALLVAKAHKLRDRLAAPKESGRLSNKDAAMFLR